VNWFPFAIWAAISSATTDAILKARFSHLSSASMAAIRCSAPAIFLFPALFFINWPRLDIEFFKTLLFLLPLEIIALILYMRAIQISDLSITIPFLAFTPVFALFTGWLILGELPKLLGIIGVLLTVIGGYSLNISESKHGLLEPIKCIFKEKGSSLMLIVAAIYSVTSVLGKKAVLLSAPLFFACFYFSLLSIVVPIVLSPFWLKDIKKIRDKLNSKTSLSSSIISYLAVAVSQASMVLCHFWAISLVDVAYMISVKRTSLFFSVIYGKILFKEQRILERLVGVAFMLVGITLILFSKG